MIYEQKANKFVKLSGGRIFFSFKLWQERMTEHKSNLSGPLSSIWPIIIRIQTLVFSKQIFSDTATTQVKYTIFDLASDKTYL